ncbi:MAG: hypothetical protein GY679_05300 [Mycoplasma sp.]|nr:hypothetical protein [Mycoplasma sp.]
MNPSIQPMPTEKELWKDEPNKLRAWIILFIFSMLVFSILSIVGAALTITQEKSFLDKIVSVADPDLTKHEHSALEHNTAKIIKTSFIAFPLIYGILALVGIIYFVSILPNSYKKNTFSNLPVYPLYLSYFVGFVAFFNLVGTYKSINIVKEFSGPLLIICTTFLSILLFFFALRVGKIRRIFISAKAYEDFQKFQQSPEFQEMQRNMQNFFNQANSGQTPNSPFETKSTSTNAGPKTSNKGPEPQQADIKEQNEESPEIKELRKMSIEDLRKIGSGLSISGYAKMSKEDLMKSIIRVTNQS